jgi:hypothetical protein
MITMHLPLVAMAAILVLICGAVGYWTLHKKKGQRRPTSGGEGRRSGRGTK